MDNRIEDLFGQSSNNYDQKHIKNVLPKPMPAFLIDKINEGVCTTEMLNTYIEQGYQIFRYRTQITIHGIASPDTNKRIAGYKCVTVNKNGSIGIKWIAIDAAKRDRISAFIYPCGWRRVQDSQEDYFVHSKSLEGMSIDEKVKVCNEFKEHAKAIDKSLFLGNVWAGVVQTLFGTYARIEVRVDSVLESNVVATACTITQRTEDDMRALYEEQQRVQREREEKWRRECDAAEKERAENEQRTLPIAQAERARLEQELLNAGYKKVSPFSLKKGTEFKFVRIIKEYKGIYEAKMHDYTITQTRGEVVFYRDDMWHKGRITNKEIQVFVK